MKPTEYIWHNGTLVPWHDAKVHVLTHTLHYGAGAFEGIRVYNTDRGPAVFRLKEHVDRLFYSAGVLRMEIPFSPEEIQEAILETLRKNDLSQGYIRPLAYLGYGVMGLNPRGAPVEVAIACWPWGAYLPAEAIDVKVSPYIRIHPQSTVADAKIVGHYVNSILAVLDLRGTDYHEALFLDHEGYVAEGPGENFFMMKEETLITPPLGTILAGITRQTVLEIADSLGIKTREEKITKEEAMAAEEAFFTGTAAEVTAIRSIDKHLLNRGEVGAVTRKIRETYLDAVQGRNPEFSHYLTHVRQ